MKTSVTPNNTLLRTPRGFTLIELLVVIAIISLIIGILLPVLPRARNAARQIGCGANLRSIGQAIEMFKNDNQREYPLARYMPNPYLYDAEAQRQGALIDDANDLSPAELANRVQDLGLIPAFNDVMERYIPRDSEAYRCPGDLDIWAVTGDHYEEGVLVEEQRVSGMSYTYLRNEQIGGKRWEDTVFYNGAFEIQTPSGERRIKNEFTERRITTMDKVTIMQDFDGGTFQLVESLTMGNRQSVRADFFHDKRMNLFADGSAGRLKTD